MASFLLPELPSVPFIESVSTGDLDASLKYSLRMPTESVQSLTAPLEIGSVNWKAVDAAELLNTIGYVYAQDRIRKKLASQLSKAEERASERLVTTGPREAKKARKRVERVKRKAASGLFRDMAYILGLKQQKLY